ncbi:MED14-domain-containing protein [Neocallimastix sp. 'constans']
MNGDDKLINDLSINSIQNDFDLLPKNEENLIPLKDIYEGVIHRYYSELLNLSETLTNKVNREKKVEIFKLIQDFIQNATKLLVLLRWAKQSKDVLKYKNIYDFLELQNSYFRGAADALHMVHQEMNLARIPNFDISTAVDVLTTGTYSRLPSIIKEPISLPPLKNEEIKDAIEKLEDVTRMRLLCDEIVPKPMKKNYVIENGAVRFTVENEFEVTLRLEGKQQDNWRLLDLKIFVKPDEDLNHDLIIPLQEYQINFLKNNAQVIISKDATNVDLNQNPNINLITNPPNAATSTNNTNSNEEEKSTTPKKIWPLIELYRYLHSFCLSMQLEIFRLQIEYLIKTRWANRLRFNMSADQKTLQLFYWNEKEKNRNMEINKNKDLKNKEGKKSNIVELSITTAEDKVVFYTNKENKEDNSNSLLIAKSQTYEYEQYIQSNLTIHCYQLLEDGTKKELIDPTTSSKVKFNINSQKLNIEKILDRVTEVHAFSILFELKNILIGKSNSNITIHKCNSNDVIEKNFYNSKTTDEEMEKQQPELIICYRINHYVKITVDGRTGRIVITEYNEQGTDNINSFIQEKIKNVEEKINKDMTKAVDYLIELRNLTIINEIELLSIYLGLEPSKKLLITQEEIKSSSRNKHDSSYFKVWLVSTKKKNSSGFLEFSLIMNLDISQLLENDNIKDDSDNEQDNFHHLRKRRCIEEQSIWDKTKYKIAYCLLTTQLKNLHIPYYFISLKSKNHVIDYDSPLSIFDLIIKIRVKDIIPDVIRKCVLGDYVLKLNNDLYITATGNTLNNENNAGPFEKFSIKNHVKGIARGIKVVAKLQIKPGELPINEDFSIGKNLLRDINFSVKTKVLTFTYSKINDCIYRILNIWKGLVMLRIIASQAYTNRDILESHEMTIDKINLLKTKILFYEKNYVEFALNSNLDNPNSNGINIIFGIKGDNKSTVFYKEKEFLIEDFLMDYNVINFLLKLKTKYKLFKNINLIEKSREMINTYSTLKVEKESLEKIKLIYNQYTIEIGQCTENLVGILCSDSSYGIQSKVNMIPQFQSFIDKVVQLHATNTPPKKSDLDEKATKEDKEKENKNGNEQTKGEEQEDCICMKIPNGIIFEIRYIDQVMNSLNKLMNGISYMDWLYNTINQIEANKQNKGKINYSKKAKGPLLLSYEGESLEFTLSFDFDKKQNDEKKDEEKNNEKNKEKEWSMKLKSNGESLKGDILIEKILNLKNPIVGFKSLTQLMILPPEIAKEILKIICLEKKENQHKVISEICLAVPEGLPGYLPNAGESAIYTDFQNKRIGLICQIYYNDVSANGQTNETSQSKHSIIIPFFYNWRSKFFCEWNGDPEFSKLEDTNKCISWLRDERHGELSRLNLFFIQISKAFEQNKEKGEKEAIQFAFNTLSSMKPEQYKAIEIKN